MKLTELEQAVLDALNLDGVDYVTAKYIYWNIGTVDANINSYCRCHVEAPPSMFLAIKIASSRLL